MGLNDALAAAWLKHRDRIFQRLTVVEAAIGASAAGTLDDAARDEARREAHKLAGSLGMFGLGAGTEPAFRLEQAFQSGDVDPDSARRDAATLRRLLEAQPLS